MFQALRCDFDTLGGLDLLVMQVGALHAELLHGMRGEQGPDGGHDGALR